MPQVQPIVSDTAEAILAWCGVDDPTPAEVSVAEIAAAAAKGAIKHYRGLTEEDSFEAEYAPLAVEMGVYLYSKRGVDGVNNFSENGVQQSYEVGSFPASMLSRIQLPVTTG